MMLVFWLFDPLGVATNSDRMSEALFYRVVAPLYPEAYADPDKATAFDDITQIAVIVINDESLANMMVDTAAGTVEIVHPEDKLKGSSATWPPSMIIHNRIVKKIFESATPKALFVDFGFFDERDPIATEEFAKTLAKHAVPNAAFKPCLGERPRSPETSCTGWIERAPIFLPRVDASAPIHLRVLQPLRDAATAMVSTTYIGEEFESYNQYDLFDCAFDSPPDSPVAPAPSAALAMYSAGGITPSFRSADCDARRTPERLSVYWSDWGDAEKGRGSFSCRTLPKTSLGRLWRIFAVWFEEGPKAWAGRVLSSVGIGTPMQANNLAESQFQDCPPHLSVSARDFLADDTGLMAAILDDRYVFYGGNFVMADDLIRPPTHNAIPGVYVHAMVLDNLLQGEDRYRKYGWLALPALLLILLAIVLAAMCSAFTWAGIVRVTSGATGDAACGGGLVSSSPCERLCAWFSHYREWPRQVIFVSGLAIGGYLMCFASLSGLAALGFFWLDLAPINLVGILSFIGLHFAVRGAAAFFDEML